MENIFAIRYPELAEKLSRTNENSLAARFPELAAEWHPTRNGDLMPDQVTTGSDKKVWWKCKKKGHEWQGRIANRSLLGRGCPYCSGRYAIPRKTDLATKNPELAAEWHPTKNGELTPDKIAPGSNKKVWWICEKGHEWQTSISKRTRGDGCPYCSGRRLIVGETDLATKDPELAAEWHPTKNEDLTPQGVTARTNRKVWWLGPCGHEWPATIRNRYLLGSGCPYCAHKRVMVKVNDLATKNPELVAEWHPTKNGELTPQEVTPGSDKKVWWICRKGHEWQALVYNRSKGHRCPVCQGEAQTSFREQAILYYMRKITIAENRNKEFGKEIDVWLPELRVGIEYNGYWHKDRKDADAAKVAFFAEQGIRIITVREGKQDRIIGDTIEYDIGKKSGLDNVITTLFRFLNLPIPSIDIAKDSMGIYDQYISLEKEKSPSVKYPGISAEWHPTKNGYLTPDMVSCGSRMKVWWICSKGHEWQAEMYKRTRGDGCPYCSGRRLIVGETDLATKAPELAAEWHPTKNGELTPDKVAPGSNKKVWWICSQGHEWEAQIIGRSSGHGCPYCSGRYAIPGKTDLATKAPELAAEWHPTRNGELTPDKVTPGSNKKVWWLGKCGHEWQAMINSRSGGGYGCPICARARRRKNSLSVECP